MSKETARTDTAPAAHLAPIFSFWRTALDEMERNADHFSQHGAGQIEEAAKVGRALRAQLMTASRHVVDGIEQLAGDAAAGAAGWSKSFGRSAA